MLLAALALGAAVEPAVAADWWLVGADSRSAMFVDRASLAREGARVTQRVAAVMPHLPVRRVEVVERLDCTAGTATDLEIVYHLANGAVVRRAPGNAPRSPKPNSVGRATFDFACGTEAARGRLGAPIGSDALEEVAELAVRGGNL